MSTAAAASATKKSSQLGLACLSTPATDDRSRQPRWTEEDVPFISDNVGQSRKDPGEFGRQGGGDGRRDPERRALRDLVTPKEAKRRAGAAGGATRGSEGRGGGHVLGPAGGAVQEA